MKPLKLLTFIFCLIFSLSMFAQKDSDGGSHLLLINQSVIAQLNLQSTSTKAISLNAKAPTKAGKKLRFNQKNSDLWINYSSIVEYNSSRNIIVQIIDGNVPEGVDLTVTAKNYKGDGQGDFGKTIGEPILLNNKKASKIITDIGSAYTGNGAKKGHNLIYKIAQSKEKDAYANRISEKATLLTIMYTLSDN